MRTLVVIVALLLIVFLPTVGCSAQPITFSGQASPLSGFSYDTGLQPTGSPVQLDLKLSANGTVSVTAQANVQDTSLAPVAQSGSLALDLHFVAAGELKIDSTFENYDGPIPGLQNIDIAATGTTTFDPFLLSGDSAVVTAPIPATQLPDIPLGSIPGALQLAIGDGSSITSTFQGTCLSTSGGNSSYQGTVTTSGTLVIQATIALQLPSPLDQSVALPNITVSIPAATTPIDLGTQATPGVTDNQRGSCAPSGSDGGAPDASTDGPGSDSPSTSDGSTPTCHPAGAACTDNVNYLCCTKTCDETTQLCLAPANVLITQPTNASVLFVHEAQATGNESLNLDIEFFGPGLGAQTRLDVIAATVGSGCNGSGTNNQGVQYTPDDGTNDYYYDDGTPSCGLDITSMPPGHVTGTFSGTLHDSNNKPVSIAFSFDAPPP